ncbi:MAG: hypothetical protein EAZ71_12110 [Verrucomicrobia bacterium]|nr:MAG: hypothetical protein EAZ71_12110 [Verrucomicrobiota bacterium]
MKPSLIAPVDKSSHLLSDLSMLEQRPSSGQPGMSNAEIRPVLKFHRNQVFKLLQVLRTENLQVVSTGHGAGARYEGQSE